MVTIPNWQRRKSFWYAAENGREFNVPVKGNPETYNGSLRESDLGDDHHAVKVVTKSVPELQNPMNYNQTSVEEWDVLYNDRAVNL